MEITVKSNKTDREIAFDYDAPKNLAEAVERYGEDVVFSFFEKVLKIKVQDAARRILNDEGKSEEEAIAAGQGLVPGVIRRGGARKSPKQKLLDAVGSASEEEKEELIATLQAMLEG